MKSFRFLPLLLACAMSAVARAETVAPRINHLAFYVADLKISADFYEKIIGLPVIPEPFKDGRHAWFLIGPKTHLHIISGSTARLPKEKKRTCASPSPRSPISFPASTPPASPSKTGWAKSRLSPTAWTG